MKFVTLATLASTALAGNINIVNNCNLGLFWQLDTPFAAGQPSWLAPGRGTTVLMSGEGNALKFATVPLFQRPISFDFSLPAAEEGRVYYDVSNKAGQPFAVYATPERGSGCEAVSCPSGDLSTCATTRACSSDVNFVVETCYKNA